MGRMSRGTPSARRSSRVPVGRSSRGEENDGEEQQSTGGGGDRNQREAGSGLA